MEDVPKTKQCPTCMNYVHQDAYRCEHCHVPLRLVNIFEGNDEHNKIIGIIFALAFVVIIILLVVAN